MSEQKTPANNAPFSEVAMCIDVRGDGLPADVITNGIGLQPTRVLRKGHPDPANPNRISTVDAWMHWSPLARCINLEARIKEDIAHLQTRVPFLEHLRAHGLAISLSAAVYGRGMFPSIGFSPATLAILAELAVSLDIDCYGTDDPEEAYTHL